MRPTASAAWLVQPEPTLAIRSAGEKFIVDLAAPESHVVVS